MAAPQDDGTALVVSENNTDDSSPRENGQVIYCLERMNMYVHAMYWRNVMGSLYKDRYINIS